MGNGTAMGSELEDLFRSLISVATFVSWDASRAIRATRYPFLANKWLHSHITWECVMWGIWGRLNEFEKWKSMETSVRSGMTGAYHPEQWRKYRRQ